MSEISTEPRRLSRDGEAVEALAQQTNRPIAEVRVVFEAELARLRNEARVTDYLLLFASRRARDVLLRGTG